MKYLIKIQCITFLLISLATGGEPPADVKNLIINREKAIAQIDIKFLRELEKIKIKYTKAGDLENANMVLKLIKQTSKKNTKEDVCLEGKWIVNDLKHSIRTFIGNKMIDEYGYQHPWSHKDGIITIDYGKGTWEKLQIDPNNTDILKGVNSLGGPHVYKRLQQ